MRYTALLIFFLAVCWCSAQTPFTRARLILRQDKPANALPLLDSCIAKDYYKDSTLFYKGLTYLKMYDVEAALKTSKTLIKTYPAFSEGHYLNGLAQFSDENYGKSIDEFNLVLKANPQHIKALYNRSVAFGQLEEFLMAIEDLSACIALDPDYALAYYSRAYWYEYTGNYAEATKDYETTIRLDPKNYDAYYGLAYMYYSQKDPGKACEVINNAISQGSQIAEELKNNFCR
jgi:tetratricopeptide (TPR) repeat protein